MGIGPHDDGNSIADSLGYQNNRVPKFDTERNVAVPKIMDANVWQIGELSAAGQLLVERCARHVEYAVVRGQPVEPGTVGAELFGQPMRNRHIAVSAFLAVLSGAEDVLPLFSVVGLVDAQLVIIGQVFGQQRQHLALAASRPEQNIKCQKIGLIAEFFPQKLVLVFRDDKHFPGDGGTHVARGIARIETQAVERLGIVEERGQLCVNGVEVCFRIGEASGFAHLFYSLLPISNIKSGDLIHFPVSEKRTDFGVKNISLGVHCGVADMVLPVIEVQLHKAGKESFTAEQIVALLSEYGRMSGCDADMLDGKHADAFAADKHSHSASDITSGNLPIERGGTGAGTSADACRALDAMRNTGGTFTGTVYFANGTAHYVSSAGDSHFRSVTASEDIHAKRVFEAVYNDYAELMPRGEDTEPGDVIALDTNSRQEKYVKATNLSSRIAGIHSDEYGMLIGGERVNDGEDFLKKIFPVLFLFRLPDVSTQRSLAR